MYVTPDMNDKYRLTLGVFSIALNRTARDSYTHAPLRPATLRSLPDLLLDTASGLTVPAPANAQSPAPQPCTDVLLDYFTSLNSPVDVP